MTEGEGEMMSAWSTEEEGKLSAILAKAGLVHLKDAFVREKVKL